MTDLRNMDELEALDRANFLHASSDVKGHAQGTTPTRVIESGEGVYLRIVRGSVAFRHRRNAFWGGFLGHGDNLLCPRKGWAQAFTAPVPAIRILLLEGFLDRAIESTSRIPLQHATWCRVFF